jgi:cytochrome oxidase Cu insertion factor (SCO1/SenC/PrrC family)
MKPPPQQLEGLVWGALGLIVGLVLGAFAYSRLAPATRARGPALPVLSQVTGFTLTNQAGQVVTAEALRGRPWLACVIFTRCPGPCVRMTRNLAALQNRLPRESEVMLVTLTADPAFDTPEVLRRYAAAFGADTHRWHFLTGPQVELYTLATRQLLLAVGENPDPATARPEDLFIHSTRVVLVDAHGRVRASYDGEDPAALEAVLTDLPKLAAGPP